MTDRRHREDYKLAVADWPPADATAWAEATAAQPGPFSRHQSRSPFTYRNYAAGWSVFLWYLHTQGQLDLAETPIERVTMERLAGFWAMLQGRGNADYTILGRFDELRGALRLMEPDADVSFICRPHNISLRQMLPMRRKARFVPDARHVLLWTVALFEDALLLSDPIQRQLQVRDAVIIGLFASRGPRLRTLAGMRLGRHLCRRGDQWTLFFDEALMKGGRQELELPNDPRVNAMLERYVSVDRAELLGRETHDAVWVNRQGGPLAYKGIETMFRERTQQQFGIAFGPHRLRSSLVTTAAVVDGTNALAPATVLGHSPQTALQSYNRANNLEATRQHDARVSGAEDAVMRIVGDRHERVSKPDLVHASPDRQHSRTPRRP